MSLETRPPCWWLEFLKVRFMMMIIFLLSYLCMVKYSCGAANHYEIKKIKKQFCHFGLNEWPVFSATVNHGVTGHKVRSAGVYAMNTAMFARQSPACTFCTSLALCHVARHVICFVFHGQCVSLVKWHKRCSERRYEEGNTLRTLILGPTFSEVDVSMKSRCQHPFWWPSIAVLAHLARP